MIVRGQIGVAELQPETLQDPEILRISTATQLIDDDHYTKISIGKRWAEVTLHTTDGRSFTSAPRTPRGDRDDPMSDAQISEKFHLFADSVLGPARAAELEDLSGRFDTLDAEGFSRLLDLCLTAP
jgi:2-methylcitrate dehydratase PrpD